MSSKKGLSYKLLSTVTLLALVLSLFGVGIAGAAPVPAVTDQATAQPARTTIDKTGLDANKAVRVIVQLKDAPLATYTGGAGLSGTANSVTGAAKLDVNSKTSQAYLSYLTGKQNAFKAELAKAVPDAQVQYTYQVTLNGLAVALKTGQIAKVSTLPGVTAVTIEQEYKLDMDASLPLIGAGTGTVGGADWVDSGLWAALGGHENAGMGLKIADIDAGINYKNPCFDPAGFAYPAGFPKYGDGYEAFVNPKIIAARAYFRPQDPPKYEATPEDAMQSGHGSHTAGTMVCNYGTTTGDSFLNYAISGLAPKAQLMVYRVFYTSISGSESSWDPETIAAIEDVVKDGADVVNNSWGGTAINVSDAQMAAYSAAVDAGVVVVFSAGNSGSGSMTVGSPGFGEKFITVANSTHNRMFAQQLNVTGPAPVPANLTGLMAVTSADGPQGIFSGGFKHVAANALGCNAFAAGTFTGQIAVIKRGTCTFAVKVNNATAAGAIGVIIANNAGGFPISMSVPGTTVPSYMVTQADGNNLITWVTANPSATLEVLSAVGRYTDDTTQDTLATTSSRGPTPDMQLKPDLAAPGTNILSAYSGTPNQFSLLSGTSMAAPHVTGSAALLKQLHPDWTVQQIKSALMTTTAQPAALGANPVNRGAGRLNLAAPHDPGLTFDQPSLGFGLTVVGSSYTKTVTAMDVSGLGGVYTVTAVASSGGLTPVVPETISVPANGSVAFDVVISIGATGDAYGNINLTDGSANHTLHIPFWTRRVANIAAADVLLIDDDNSNLTAECTDYTGVYTQTLTALGLTYAVQEVPSSGAIDFNQAMRFGKVVYFTGDEGCGGDLSLNANALRNYLAQGGKMLITGQDIGAIDTFYNANYALTFNPSLFFGAQYVQDSVFPASVPVPAVQGQWLTSSYLGGQLYDISGSNQVSVDEIAARNYSDVSAIPILWAAPSSAVMAYGHVGSSMAWEPTIERIKSKYDVTMLGYRTEWLSFGLEGVNDTVSYNTKAELLDRLLSWMDDQVTVSFTSPDSVALAPYQPFTATATANVSLATTTTGFQNSIAYYRWDFGDSTSIQETAGPAAVHGYAKPGVYTVMVEAIDGFGHHAVASQKLTVVPAIPDLSASTKTANKATASPEEKVTYTLTIKNTGTAKARTANIHDAIPAGVTYVDGSASGGAMFEPDKNAIHWAGELAIGEEKTFTFQVMVNSDTAVGTSIVNTATFADTRTNVSVEKSATTTVVPQPVITVGAVADAWINQWLPTSNYGNASDLAVRSNDVHAALLRFDLSALPAGATVKNATMKLYANQRTNVGKELVAVFEMMKPWTEGSVTWNTTDGSTAWETPGANGPTDRSTLAVAPTWLTDAGMWYMFDVKPIVQNWANGNENNGVAVKYQSSNAFVSYMFVSHENGMMTAERPALTIQFVNP